MSQPTFRIAKDGYDCILDYDGLDTRNFIFSGYNIFKIAFTGNITFNVTWVDDGFGGTIGTGEGSFQHNLGYIPISYVSLNNIDGDTFGKPQIPYNLASTGGISTSVTYRIDNSKLYVSMDDAGIFGSTGDTFQCVFSYQIMYDKII